MTAWTTMAPSTASGKVRNKGVRKAAVTKTRTALMREANWLFCPAWSAAAANSAVVNERLKPEIPVAQAAARAGAVGVAGAAFVFVAIVAGFTQNEAVATSCA